MSCHIQAIERRQSKQSKNLFIPRDPMFVIYDKEILNKLCSLIINEPCTNIVDLGSCNGTLAEFMRKKSSGKVTVVDKCMTNPYLHKDIVTVEGDIFDSGLKTGAYDLVTCTQVIEHVDDKALLNEIYRLLKPNGYALITTPLKLPGAWYFCKNKYGERVLEPTHIREYKSVGEVTQLLGSQFSNVITRTPPLKYPLVDPILKLGIYQDWMECLRKIIRVRIPRYRVIEMIVMKRSW